jgi:hypothetical protein
MHNQAPFSQQPEINGEIANKNQLISVLLSGLTVFDSSVPISMIFKQSGMISEFSACRRYGTTVNQSRGDKNKQKFNKTAQSINQPIEQSIN